MPTRRSKRKAEEEPEEVESSEEEESPSPKKLSKKEKLAEQKARAKEWAERAAASSKKTSTTPKKTTTTPKKTSSTSRPTKRHKLNTGQASQRALSKREQREQAKARASAWAEQGATVKPNAATRKTPVKSTPTRKKTKATAGRKSTPRPARKQPEVERLVEDEEDEMEEEEVQVEEEEEEQAPAPAAAVANAQREMMQRAQQQAKAMQRAQQENAMAATFQMQLQANSMAVMNNQPLPYPQAAMAFSPPPMNAPPPPVATVPAPPSAAMGPQPARVMRPPTASVPVPAASPPLARKTTKSPAQQKKQEPAVRDDQVRTKAQQQSTATETDQVDYEPIQEEDVEMEDTKIPRWRAIGLPLLILAVVVAAVAALVSLDGSDANVAWTNETAPPKSDIPVCFLSNLEEEDEDEDLVLGNCDISKGRFPCPDGGLCAPSGELKSCIEDNYVVSESRDECILSAAAKETLARVEALLVGWTVDQYCQIQGCAHAIKQDNDGPPIFDLGLVQQQTGASRKLIKKSPDVFALQVGKNGEPTIGLTEDYFRHRLVIPFWCDLGVMGISLLAWAFGKAFSTVKTVFMFVLNVTWAFPMWSIISFVVMFALFKIRRYDGKKKQMLKDTATVREHVYDRLVEDVSQEHAIVHLRDEVAWDMHPTSKKKRAYIIEQVWKKVVADVQQDNRVVKLKVNSHGHPTAWQWTASVTPNKKNVSFD